MGQAVLSSLAQFPHVARGQISRVFETDIYDLLFAPTHPIAMYAKAIEIQRACEHYLRTDPSTRGQVDDFVFHLTMLATIGLTRKNRPSATDIAGLSEAPEAAMLADLLKILREEFAAGATRRREVLFDRVAKG